jgi:predicted alpha-1,2-mannosidase
MKTSIAFGFAWLAVVAVSGGTPVLMNATGNARFVNPLIGTANDGHTYPGATVPFGLVQASPDTGCFGWPYCSGYRYEDSTILGFSQTHLSGTGCPDLGDILLLPFTGSAVQSQYQSKFSHQDETARPGFYAVELQDYGVKAEITASERCAFYRCHFENTNEAHLLLDLRSGMVFDAQALESHVIKSELHFEDPTTISGYRITQGWGGERHVYFAMHFDQPFASKTWLAGESESRNQRVVFSFQGGSNQVLNVKIAISTVSIDGAKANLAAEMPGWNFEATAKAACEQWNELLSKVTAEAPRKDLETFYTALYHSLVAPNNLADVDGQYRGADNKVYMSEGKAYYSALSLWDVHRASIPLYTILCPEVVSQLVDTLLRHYKVTGYLPMWALWGHENNCMIGNPSIPVIAEAYLQGIISSSVAQEAFEAVKVSSTANHPKSDWTSYMRYGYLPSDMVKEEAVSRTLESAFDDGCAAEMARKMGKTEDQAYFARRSNFYTNLFDSSTGLMRGKKSDGTWVTPFDPLLYSHAGDAGGDYTEANAWNYTWHVQQDPEGLIRLVGGDEKFAEKLDRLFTLPSTVVGANIVDITGLIGQYVHGNEPCHHVAYLYSYAGMPWKTQERVREITTTLYHNTPGGIPGNDDCGQMSAWYVLSTMGFYPVNPANGIYVLGTPGLDKVSLDVGNGKKFTIETVRRNSSEFYIDHIEHDGKLYPYSYFAHADILQGGRFIFHMTSKPNFAFGKSVACRPQSQSQ